MASPVTRHPSKIKYQPLRALALLLMLTLWIPSLPVQAGDEPSPPAVVNVAATGDTAEGRGEKGDLMNFFAIGAVINILFFAAFLVWARKESQKSKKGKTGAKR